MTKDIRITFLSAVGSEGVKLFVAVSLWDTLDDRTKGLHDLETLLLLLVSW